MSINAVENQGKHMHMYLSNYHLAISNYFHARH